MSWSVSLSCSWCSLCAVSDAVFAVSTLVRSTRRRRAWPCPPDRLALAGSDRPPPRRMTRRRARWRGRQFERGRLTAHPGRVVLPTDHGRSLGTHVDSLRGLVRCRVSPPTAIRSARALGRVRREQTAVADAARTLERWTCPSRWRFAGATGATRRSPRRTETLGRLSSSTRSTTTEAGPPEPSGWPLCMWGITAGVR